jgi:hypothetical protein
MSYQQKIHILLTWIEENSYSSSKDSTCYTKDITKIEETTKDWNMHEGCESTSITLHNYPNFIAQRGGTAMQNHWNSPWSTPTSAPSWRDSLRLADVISAAIVATSLLIRALIITIKILGPVGALSASTEAVEVGLTVVEVATSLVPKLPGWWHVQELVTIPQIST